MDQQVAKLAKQIEKVEKNLPASQNKPKSEPGKLSKKPMIVQATSAGFENGNCVEITIDEITVEMERNENNHDRGLHIVVINQTDGMVETAQVFDTYKTSVTFDAFISGAIPQGRIVVAACKDECITQLSDAGKTWFEEMGSTEIRKLEYRQGFAFIGIMGQNQEVNEKRETLKNRFVTVTQIFLVEDNSALAWYDSPLEQRIKQAEEAKKQPPKPVEKLEFECTFCEK